MILNNESIIQYDLNELNKLSVRDKKVIDYYSEKYNVHNRWKSNDKNIRNNSLKNIINILEKNNIEYKLNSNNDYKNNLKSCNIIDIVDCLINLKEIKNIMELFCLEKNNYDDVSYDYIKNDVDNLLYNVINNLKEKCSNIKELEKEIIIICNNTVEKFNLNIEKISGWD